LNPPPKQFLGTPLSYVSDARSHEPEAYMCWVAWLYIEYIATKRHNCTTSDWTVSPYTQHINTQISANNFISTLYINIDIRNFYLKFDVWCL